MTSTRVNELVAEMTLDEKCLMLSGRNAWDIPGCERLGVPEWNVSDGPVGVRGRMAEGAGSVKSLVVPGPSGLAATWDPDLIGEIGEALGAECLDRNVDMLLAPTTNLHRSPMGGRHFESYSEEPLLSSRIAVAYIRGVQSKGVGACIKHYVANDQEFERMTIDVQVDERTLREIYLPPFEAAVAEAEVRGVMAAYNYVNGEHACTSRNLLVNLLKEEWGFSGLVVSDWAAMKDGEGPANGGLDLEMPGSGKFWGEGRLADAVNGGAVDEALVDDKVRRILSFLEWRNRLDAPTDHSETENERPEHRALARRTAVEATVLVKNDSATLPLGEGRSIAVIGALADRTAIQGGGSAHLPAYRRSSVLRELRERLGDRIVGYAPGVNMRRIAAPPPADWLVGDTPVTCRLVSGVDFSGEVLEVVETADLSTSWIDHPGLADDRSKSVRQTAQVRVPESASYEVMGLGIGIVTVKVDEEVVATTQEGDPVLGFVANTARAVIELVADRTYAITVEAIDDGSADQPSALVSLRMGGVPEPAADLRAEAVALAGRADLAVVVVGTTSQWESEGEDRPDLELPAAQSALVEAVAAANPKTVVVLNSGSPIDMPWFDEVAAVLLGWYPGQEGGAALVDVLLGDADPGGRMPTTWAVQVSDTPSFGHYPGENGVVRYGEGVFVGYRHYDRKAIAPRVAFGHGGSYASFEWGAPTVTMAGTPAGATASVEVPITNMSERSGTEVVQVYVGPAEADPERPDKVLAGFAKLAIAAGESAMATIEIRARAFETWVEGGGWQLQPGDYTVSVAASAVDVRHTSTISISAGSR